MKNVILIILVCFAWSYAGAQNIRFSYSVSNPDVPNNQSKLTVKMYNIGPDELMAGFNFGFYYKSSEATIQGQAANYSGTLNATALGLCIDFSGAVAQGWAPIITGAVSIIASPPPPVPSGYDRLFIGSISDDNVTGSNVSGLTQIPMIALILNNTPGGDPINQDSAFQAGSDTNGSWVYSYTDPETFEYSEFPIVVDGNRLKTLPIELVSFNAKKFNDRHASITWSTASEINSSHFVVQRSFDKKTWTNAGSVGAAGLSSIIMNYSFVDENVYNGRDSRLNVYYRLQMFDLDGRNKFSPIEIVRFGTDATVASTNFDVYPNPATEGVQVEWDGDNLDQQPTSFEFYDIEGKLILTQKVSDNTNQEYVDFRSISIQPGVYVLRIMNGSEPIEHKQIVIGQNR